MLVVRLDLILHNSTTTTSLTSLLVRIFWDVLGSGSDQIMEVKYLELLGFHLKILATGCIQAFESITIM